MKFQNFPFLVFQKYIFSYTMHPIFYIFTHFGKWLKFKALIGHFFQGVNFKGY